MIQNRINKLKPYFKGLKIAENYRIVEVNLKNSWNVQEDPNIEVQQKQTKENKPKKNENKKVERVISSPKPMFFNGFGRPAYTIILASLLGEYTK